MGGCARGTDRRNPRTGAGAHPQNSLPAGIREVPVLCNPGHGGTIHICDVRWTRRRAARLGHLLVHCTLRADASEKTPNLVAPFCYET